MLVKTKEFKEVRNTIKNLISTRRDRRIYKNTYGMFNPLKLSDFSEEGLSQVASKLQFPAQFVQNLEKGDEEHKGLANRIVRLKYNDYFKKEDNTALFERRFNNKIYAMLSEKYAFFDDDEILPIIERSDYLMNGCEEFWYSINPRHTHIRFVSKNKLYVDGDDSPLSMCVFIDNSMIGYSSFRIRFGLFRWACTNGMISGLKEFEVLRETHTGEKDFTKLTLEALEEIPLYEKMLLDQVERMQATHSMIYEMGEEDAKDKIKDYLNTSKKVANKVFELYKQVYGGASEWDLCNAITQAAQDVDLETRIKFERKAFVSKGA